MRAGGIGANGSGLAMLTTARRLRPLNWRAIRSALSRLALFEQNHGRRQEATCLSFHCRSPFGRLQQHLQR
jgi:hypothetical protein